MRKLKTVDDVFEEFKDVMELAGVVGANYHAAMKWRQRERFPTKYFRKMRVALAERDCEAPESLWGMS